MHIFSYYFQFFIIGSALFFNFFFSFTVRNGGKYLLSRKTNLLNFSIKIGTYPSLLWFDQSLVISCLCFYCIPFCVFSNFFIYYINYLFEIFRNSFELLTSKSSTFVFKFFKLFGLFTSSLMCSLSTSAYFL